jgi:enoyl-CoA hydratase/carnithine racemase
MSGPDSITVTIDGHVATVEIHRPPHNWFDLDVITTLADRVLALDDEVDCRALVLCSEGKNFCAGANLGETDVVENTSALYGEAVRLFSNRKPIVAAVQGAAVGGGLGLALSADFRVASPETRFSCNFSRLGFHPGFGISVTLPAVIGAQRALELMYTSRDVRGEEALALGLADRVVPASELRTAAHAFAEEIASAGPLALLAIRDTMRGDLAARVRAATALERERQEALRVTEDFREGVQAMAERRTPEFTGR